MTESEMRKHRCCFTGHRPENLDIPAEKVQKALNEEILTAISDGFQVFISGMARGTDIWAAENVLALRNAGELIKLICASPYRGFESRWSRNWQERYQHILNSADLVRFICPGYSCGCFQRRNEWMVDHSARLVAVYTGKPGGTRNTIEYAKAKKVQVVLPRCLTYGGRR